MTSIATLKIVFLYHSKELLLTFKFNSSLLHDKHLWISEFYCNYLLFYKKQVDKKITYTDYASEIEKVNLLTF